MKKSKLLQYSSMAVTFIASGANTGAQAVYVDIDPDTVLFPPYGEFAIDFNDFGLIDYRFENESWFGYAEWCECYEQFNGLLMGNSPSIAAYSDILFSSNTYFASALEFNQVIDSNLEFNNHNAYLAYHIIPDWSIYYVFEGGDWFPEAIDKYVGIRFEDTLDCMHYGWIRCSIEDGGSNLTIKDYAYETKCDVGIAAGDMVGNTTVGIEEINTLEASVYSFGESLYTNVINFAECTLTICNLQGQEILHQYLTETNTVINMKFYPTGIYLIRLTDGDRFFIKKIKIK